MFDWALNRWIEGGRVLGREVPKHEKGHKEYAY